MPLQHADIISREMNLMRKHVSACLKLLDTGATIPFISRYRKEFTGGMNDVTVFAIAKRHKALTELDSRKEYIINTIEGKGALTDELRELIDRCEDATVLEDIYLPYKSKRKTRSQLAIDHGLEPLAKLIMAQNGGVPDKMARRFVTEEVKDVDEALNGVSDIIAQWVNENAKARSLARSRYQRGAVITSKAIKGRRKTGRFMQITSIIPNRCASVHPTAIWPSGVVKRKAF